MSTKRQHLIDQIGLLVESSARLRAELEGYEATMTSVGARLEAGEPGVQASSGTAIPDQRRQVTESIQEFEAARHRLRLALFALGKEEGASISEIGRVLGISRQLASRLAGEAAGAR